MEGTGSGPGDTDRNAQSACRQGGSLDPAGSRAHRDVLDVARRTQSPEGGEGSAVSPPTPGRKDLLGGSALAPAPPPALLCSSYVTFRLWVLTVARRVVKVCS